MKTFDIGYSVAHDPAGLAVIGDAAASIERMSRIMRALPRFTMPRIVEPGMLAEIERGFAPLRALQAQCEAMMRGGRAIPPLPSIRVIGEKTLPESAISVV